MPIAMITISNLFWHNDLYIFNEGDNSEETRENNTIVIFSTDNGAGTGSCQEIL